MKRYLFWGSLAIVVLLGGFLWAGPTIFPVEQDTVVPFQLAEVKRGEIFSRVTTTGSVNPVLSVTVSTQVSGTIKVLTVDVNSRVEVGQVIARLDQDLFRAEVLQAEAKLEDALANLAKEKAGVKMQKDQIEASIAETRASYKNLEEKYKRAAELFRRELVSKEEFDGIKAEWEMAASRFKESSARVDETKVKQANIQAAEAKVKIAQAELELKRVELKRSVIQAPVAGMVIAKNVEAGQTVAASLSSPPLVTIAELSKMKVDAWVDESDIGSVREGQEVQFQVDSYPGRTFNGKVVKIYPTPQVLNNVVTYDTEIHVDNEDLALKPGMTANVTIILVRKDSVLLAPHAALRVRRNEIQKLYPELQDEPRRGRKGRKGKGSGRAGGQRPRDRGSIWVFRDGKPERVRIRYGARDAKNMEVLSGLNEGDQVIVGIRVDAMQAAQTTPRTGRARWIRRRILGGF